MIAHSVVSWPEAIFGSVSMLAIFAFFAFIMWMAMR